MRIVSVALLVLAATLSAAGADNPALSRQANKAFLAANAGKPGVISARGIQYRVLRTARGAQPDQHDCATVYYKGNLIDGTTFDATKPGQPATFPVGGLIKGWTIALPMMHEGEEWELVVPSDLAYGSRGAGGVIPPDQTLVFDITLLKVSAPLAGRCS